MRTFGMSSTLMAAATEAPVASGTAAEKPEWQPLADMTIKKLGCDPKDAIRANAGKGGNVYLCRIFGEAVAIKTKEAKSGDMYSYLIGEFRAVNGNNEKYEATKLFLPGRLMEEVETALASAEGAPVQFGYDIYSTVDKDSSVGYKYAAKSVVKTEASSRLNDMAKTLESKPLPKGDKVG